MIIFYKILAILIVIWAIPTAFDPKYRYNDHMKWQPEFIEIAWMWFLAIFVIGSIFIH